MVGEATAAATAEGNCIARVVADGDLLPVGEDDLPGGEPPESVVEDLGLAQVLTNQK